MAREDLFGQSLEIKEHPARVVTTEHQGKILVAYGDSVVWSFEIDECQTWFVSQNQSYHTSCRAYITFLEMVYMIVRTKYSHAIFESIQITSKGVLSRSRYRLVLRHGSSAVPESILCSIYTNQGFGLGISIQVSDLLA